MAVAKSKKPAPRAKKSAARRQGKLSLGGAPIGAYRKPLGGRAPLLASLPLNAVAPTPFQRDLSPTHAKRLAAKIDEKLWTPNARHRLAAGKTLGLAVGAGAQD